MKTVARKSNVTRLRPAGKPKLKAVRNRLDPVEWQARVELAAAYRLTALMGWTDMLGTHISCRVPGTHDQFLLNPYGMLFEEITASSLIKVDVDGNKLSDSPYEVNQAGFTIHSAIHMGKHDADAVMHLHTAYGVGVATQKQGLLPATQMSLTALNLVRYHDYEGVAFDLTERERLIKSLGDGGMLILRNHGTLTVGATIGEMFHRMYRLERACKFQIHAMTGGAELNPLPREIVDHAIDQGRQIYAKGGQSEGGKLVWAAMVRKLDRVDPGYAV
jgi:ribulose-5-phosphate 4-epimerase/fuculose-1-phosphate aldolase